MSQQLTDPNWLRTHVLQQDMHANASGCVDAWHRRPQSGEGKGYTLLLSETNSMYAEGPMDTFLNGFWYNSTEHPSRTVKTLYRECKTIIDQ